MTLAEALLESVRLRSLVNQGIDPAAERKRAQLVAFKTVNDVAEDWLDECRKRLENPQTPERVYRNDVAPYIGEFKIEHVKPLDILAILRKIKKAVAPQLLTMHCITANNYLITA